MYFHNLPTSSIKFTSDAGTLFPGTISAMQTEEIDVTFNPLSPTGPLGKWPAIDGGMAVSTRATATAMATLPFVVGTGVLFVVALRGGGQWQEPCGVWSSGCWWKD